MRHSFYLLIASSKIHTWSIVTICLMALMYGLYWYLFKRNPEMTNDKRLSRKLLMVGMSVISGIILLVNFPVEEEARQQLTTLIGVLISATVAFSSTSLLSNFMAGMMLRITRPFETGDFIRVGSHFGRVADRGLLDTEIQTEYRELVSLPNSYLIQNPISSVHASGTIVSADLSLGYDVHHAHIQNLLLQAAEETGLEEAYVQIIELGNDAVSYRISGLLKEVKSMLTTRSNLYRSILEVFHAHEVEIVSPHFMNQRQLPNEKLVIPAPIMVASEKKAQTKAEDVAFDKAEQAEQKEKAIALLHTEIDALENQVRASEEQDQQRLQALVELKREELAQLEADEETD